MSGWAKWRNKILATLTSRGTRPKGGATPLLIYVEPSEGFLGLLHGKDYRVHGRDEQVVPANPARYVPALAWMIREFSDNGDSFAGSKRRDPSTVRGDDEPAAERLVAGWRKGGAGREILVVPDQRRRCQRVSQNELSSQGTGPD